RTTTGTRFAPRSKLRGSIANGVTLKRTPSGKFETVRHAMPDLRPFLVLGLALGGVFALSGVGLVVLFRATGVLNLAYGAVGATGALIAWSLINSFHVPDWLAYALTIVFGGGVPPIYGMLFGPPLAQRDPLVKAVASLGLALILLGVMSWAWSYEAHSLVLPTTRWSFALGGVRVNGTQIIGLALGI